MLKAVPPSQVDDTRKGLTITTDFAEKFPQREFPWMMHSAPGRACFETTLSKCFEWKSTPPLQRQPSVNSAAPHFLLFVEASIQEIEDRSVGFWHFAIRDTLANMVEVFGNAGIR